MASVENSVKTLEHCIVSPSSATHFTLPLTFFDLFWLRFHPVERIFFYSLHAPQSHPSFFFHNVVPKLKTSLSHTLQHFLPLAGNIVWPSDSPKPFIQFNPGDDGVSLVLAQCDDDECFNHALDYSPRDATESRALVPHLESSDSVASVISLQITLFPNKGFCIGISAHHAVLDGKSSTMFIKAWAYVCKSSKEESSSPTSLVPELEPFFERELIKDPIGSLEKVFIDNWLQIPSQLKDHFETSNGRSLKIMSTPIQNHSVRATFELTRGDLDKIKKRVLSKWESVAEEAKPIFTSSKPSTLSTFVISCAYVSVCIAKAFQEAEKVEKFVLGLNADCRARLEPPIPENYFGNCVVSHAADTQSKDFIKENGVVIVAKKIWNKVKMLDKGAFDGVDTYIPRLMSMLSEGVKVIGVAGSNRFGLYGTDFGWGRPAKVELTSVDRGLTIGLVDRKDGSSGVEVGLVLNEHVMDLFHEIFHSGLHYD
ncbi:phenolic glucoside malonyltransferase 1-like [Abrus precatorius]|uniref:Phenolic glucoside malonyltransferase 1-like n=1 Tax=Abrus precatorius TaxID=3816 RepID=A0A8B8L4D3_ABRPR|nr:phenolic glucoside malonyltransferase 1-like [Abrus precatorius]